MTAKYCGNDDDTNTFMPSKTSTWSDGESVSRGCKWKFGTVLL